ncbi:MAG: hypothetical protein QXT64_08505 [Desulfurococcaceae archaeon]
MIVEVWRLRDELVKDGFKFSVRVLDGGREVIFWKSKEVLIDGRKFDDELTLTYVDARRVELNYEVVAIYTHV